MAQVASTSQAAGGTGSPLSCSAPSGIVSGDLILAFVNTAQNNTGVYTGITPPAGFTLVANQTVSNTGYTLNSSLYYKAAGGSEPGSYSFSFDAASSGRITMLRITGWYSGYTMTDSGKSYYSSGTSVATTDTYSINPPALTYATDLVLYFAAAQGATDFSVAVSGKTPTKQIVGTSQPSAVAYSDSTAGTTYPGAAFTPLSSNTYQANTMIFFAVPTDRVVASPLTLTGAVNQPTFLRLILPAPLNAAFTLSFNAAGTIGRAWQNLAKSVSSWTTTPKS